MARNSALWAGCFLTCLPLWACAGDSGGSSTTEKTASASAQLEVAVSDRSVSFEFADVSLLPAGIAAGTNVIFIGDPLEGRVIAYSRFTGRPIGELPPPPGGFVIPFIMHELGDGLVGVLGAGGLPQPDPFVPVTPTIYEFAFADTPAALTSFSAHMTRAIDFSSVLVGFPEDFTQLDDGRILMTDAALGSIWVAQTDGTITPGVVPQDLRARGRHPRARSTASTCPR